MRLLHARQASIPHNITQCGTLNFNVPVQPPTTPPYSLIVYEGGKITTVYPLTVDRRFISWTVVYPAGSTIVYNVVDSEGKSFSNPLGATVQNGSSACLPPPDNRTTPLVVTSDVLRDLSTCFPLNVRIDGGQKPYTVSLVPIEVAPVINITLGANHDSLYWVNVLLPDTAIIVTVSDSQGVYGFSERFITSGNNSTTCPGQVISTHSFNSRDPFGQRNDTTSTAATPTGGSSPNIADNGSNVNNSQNDGGRTAGIVGGAMGAIILLGLLFIFYRHRKRHRRDHEQVADLIPDPIPFTHSTPGESMNQTGVSSTSFGHSYNLQSTSSSGYAGVTSVGVAGTRMNGISQKAARGAEEQGVQVRQHTDAMGVVELPPAYKDASLQ